MDPFDLFQMFFNNIPNNIQNQRARNARRERQNFHSEEDANNHGREHQRLTPRDLLIKFMPFIILTLFTIIPYVFKTVKNNFLYLLNFWIETLLSIWKKCRILQKNEYYRK